MKFKVVFLISILFLTESVNAQLELPQIFDDHMVLQRETEVGIWGKAAPNSEVTIESSWGKSARVKVTESGDWKTTLSTTTAGGPYTLSIKTDDTIATLKDVYLGEVWLASGQSNMEMPLKGWPPYDTINYAAQELKEASKYPQIRMFTVEKAMDATPQDDVVGDWLVSTTQNAHVFSASAYFFARKLHGSLGVPIGIIHSSWGGTPAEAWTSKEGLKKIGDFDAVFEQLKDVPQEMAGLTEWLSGFPSFKLPPDAADDIYASLDFEDVEASKPSYDDSQWDAMQLPGSWEKQQLGEFDGVVWYRKKITLDELEDGTYTLSLGPIDDMDVSYVNGVKVGEVLEDGHWQKKRTYEVPNSVLNKGENLIALQVLDVRGGGGLWGDDKQMMLITPSGKKIPLAGDWKFLPSAELRNSRFYLFGIKDSKYMEKPHVSLYITPGTPAMLYNAMIAPLMNFTVKGTIWYQGEANVGRGAQYERLFPALINDWRTKFGKDMPFYFVQIAPYKYGGKDSTASAAIRDAQRKTLSLANTGMVVTMDIGNVDNIHPSNKQDVGGRLGLLALANTYAKDIVASGPLVKEVSVKGKKAVVSFDHVADGLTQKGEYLTGFEVAGEDNVFYPANAKIKGKAVEVLAKEVKSIKYVRYAYYDNVQAYLFNSAGLPASSFEIEVK